MNRYDQSERARQVLVCYGLQTLGVATALGDRRGHGAIWLTGDLRVG